MTQYRIEENDQATNNWVYMDGKLYHAGVKGMQWGKHLPGTDWWKDTPKKISGFFNTQKTFPSSSAVKNSMAPSSGVKGKPKVSKAGSSAMVSKVSSGSGSASNGTRYGRSFGGRVRRIVDRTKSGVSNFARNSYSSARDSVHKYFESANKSWQSSKIDSKTSLSHLESWMKKEQREAAHSYVLSKVQGGAGNAINSFIQTAQFNIVSGINRFLVNNNLDGKVDKFLSKIFGNSKLQDLGEKIAANKQGAFQDSNPSGYDPVEAYKQRHKYDGKKPSGRGKPTYTRN